MTGERLLLVDDEDNLRSMLEAALRYSGFEVHPAATGRQALDLVDDVKPDLVVLDVMLPDLDGFDVCQRLRSSGNRSPVLFLTARDATEDKVRGLTMGGDDYLVKPFSLEELVARINAILRRTGAEKVDAGLRCADLEMDDDAHRVTRAGTEAQLSPTEYNLLRYLLVNKGRVVSKAQILDHVWQYDFGGDGGVVETYIGYLRRKVDAVDPRLIHTIRGVGYTLRENLIAMSLRARLLLGMALVAIVLVGAAVVVARTTERHLVAQVDAQLRDSPYNRRPFGQIFRPGGFAPSNQGDQGTITPAGTSGPPGGVNSFYVALVTTAGEVTTLAEPNARNDAPPLPVIDADQAFAHTDGKAYTVGSEGDVSYRVVAEPIGGPGGSLIVTALPLDDVRSAVDRLIVVEVTATVAIIAVLGLVVFWVLRLGVRPVKQMTATAAAIAAGDLSHRVPTVAPGTEAGELGVALNKMLTSIEEAFDQRARSQDRLRQFVADASHELRTPVATVRGYAELHRVGGLREPEQVDDAMGRIEHEARRMGALVDDLLLLARLDQGRPLEREPVDLATVVGDAGRDARAMAPDRTVTVEVPPGPVVVLGDDHRLRQVVANLVGNALVHSPPEATVALSAEVAGERAVVEVTDTGPGMAPEAAARAFERFFRADPSRARHRGGSGLGLSIVQASVEAHGGTVALRTAPGEGTTVRVELPLAGGSNGSGPPPPPAPSAPDGSPWGAPPQA